MDEDFLKLSVYMAERRRTRDGFVSELLLGLYERHRIAHSIVLRGIGGFGAGSHFRTDASLTLSEDPPVMIQAVDTKHNIDAVLDPVLATRHRGIVTLEHARLLRDNIGAPVVPADSPEAVKLTIYLGRKERVYGMPAYLAVCDLMYRRQLAGASVFMGVDGTAHGNRQRARFFSSNPDVPMMVIAVGSGELIGRVLPELGGLLERPMIVLERARVCKRDGELLERPHSLPGVDEHGLPLWQKLMIYTSESARYGGVPIHRALVQRLWRRKKADGATVLRGIWGFHGDHRPHGDKPLSLSRHVPVVTVLVDTPANIADSFDIVDELTRDQGLVTSEMVPASVSDEHDHAQGRPRIARHRY